MPKILHRKHNLYIEQETGFDYHNIEYLLGRIASDKDTAYVRTGDQVYEIIWGGVRFINPRKPNQKMVFPTGAHLFQMVKKDALHYIKKHKIDLPKKQPSEIWNENYRYKNKRTPAIQRKEIRIDLNHAYWRIAFLLGIIREETYLAGLDKPEYKTTRLSALAVLGKGKEYKVIRNGKETDDIIRVGQNLKLEQVYSLIRYTCYMHMKRIYKLIGNDFLFYKVDEVGFYGSAKNLKIVREYLKQHNLPAKEYI